MSGHTGLVEIPRVGPLAQDSANAICREKTWKKEISTCQSWHLWGKAPISQNIAKYQMVRMAIWVQELEGCRVRRSGCRPVQLKCLITQAVFPGERTDGSSGEMGIPQACLSGHSRSIMSLSCLFILCYRSSKTWCFYCLWFYLVRSLWFSSSILSSLENCGRKWCSPSSLTL